MNQNTPTSPNGSKTRGPLIALIIVIVLIAALVAVYFTVFKKSSTKNTVATETPAAKISSSPLAVSPSSVKATHCLKNPVKSDQIIVTSPADYSVVNGEKLVIRGTANAFENQFDYRIKDCNDEQLASGFVQAEGDMGTNPPFEREFSLDKMNTPDIIIEFYETSAADGSEIHLTQIPLRLQ